MPGQSGAGRPNLTDGIWLHGGSLATVRETIEKGLGTMPAHAARLGETRQTTGRLRVIAGPAAASRPSPVRATPMNSPQPGQRRELGERAAPRRDHLGSFLAAALGTMLCFAFWIRSRSRRRPAGLVDLASGCLRDGFSSSG
jgi:hypothetical protein